MRGRLLAVSIAGVFVPAGYAGATVPTLLGAVGPGFTIQLKHGTKWVTKLRVGTYLLVVSDRSPIHDFHVSGLA